MSTTFPRVRGVRLVATDADWAVGDGAAVEGPIQALVMVLTGRTAALDRLEGPGLDVVGAGPGASRRS